MEHKKEPIAISRPDKMGQRIRYSHINNIAGVITACRKSEQGNIMDHSLKRNIVFDEGQQFFPARTRRRGPELVGKQHNTLKLEEPEFLVVYHYYI